MPTIHIKQTNMTISSQSIKKNKENELYMPLAEDLIFQAEESSLSSTGSNKNQNF
jgi:hypothetical protein